MQEKSEKPTQKRLKKSKEGGETAQSNELAGGLIILGSLLLLGIFAPMFVKGLASSFIGVFSRLNNPFLDGSFQQAFYPILRPLALLVGGAFLIAFLSHFFQIGWIWKWKKGKRKERPRIFFNFIKIVIISTIFFSVWKGSIEKNHIIQSLDVSQTYKLLIKKIYIILIKISVAYVAIGFLDFFYQKWKHFKSMHMTNQEIKEEKKEAEGDFQTKSKMKKR